MPTNDPSTTSGVDPQPSTPASRLAELQRLAGEAGLIAEPRRHYLCCMYVHGDGCEKFIYCDTNKEFAVAGSGFWTKGTPADCINAVLATRPIEQGETLEEELAAYKAAAEEEARIADERGKEIERLNLRLDRLRKACCTAYNSLDKSRYPDILEALRVAMKESCNAEVEPPMTAEEADKAYDEAEAIPISDAEIDALVNVATSGTRPPVEMTEALEDMKAREDFRARQPAPTPSPTTLEQYQAVASEVDPRLLVKDGGFTFFDLYTADGLVIAIYDCGDSTFDALGADEDWTPGTFHDACVYAAQQLPVSQEQEAATPTGIEHAFIFYAAKWRVERNDLSSSVTVICDCPSYRAIIALGKPVVPFILEDLRKETDFWFQALQEITGADPIKQENCGRINAMAQDWIDWGVAKGIIKPAEASGEGEALQWTLTYEQLRPLIIDPPAEMFTEDWSSLVAPQLDEAAVEAAAISGFKFEDNGHQWDDITKKQQQFAMGVSRKVIQTYLSHHTPAQHPCVATVGRTLQQRLDDRIDQLQRDIAEWRAKHTNAEREREIARAGCEALDREVKKLRERCRAREVERDAAHDMLNRTLAGRDAWADALDALEKWRSGEQKGGAS